MLVLPYLLGKFECVLLIWELYILQRILPQRWMNRMSSALMLRGFLVCTLLDSYQSYITSSCYFFFFYFSKWKLLTGVFSELNCWSWLDDVITSSQYICLITYRSVMGILAPLPKNSYSVCTWTLVIFGVITYELSSYVRPVQMKSSYMIKSQSVSPLLRRP